MKTTFLKIAIGLLASDVSAGQDYVVYESSADAPSWPNDPRPFCNMRIIRDYEWHRIVADTQLAHMLYAEDTLGNRSWRGCVNLDRHIKAIDRTRLQLLDDVATSYTRRHSEPTHADGRVFAAGWRPSTLAAGVTRFSTRDPEISEALAILQWLNWWAQYSVRQADANGLPPTVLSVQER